MKDESKTKVCCFCGSERLKLLYSDVYHPYKLDHGPFNFYKCSNCASGLTFPAPSPNQLVELYRSFKGGLIPRIREIRNVNPLTKWYNQCIEHSMAPLIFQNNPHFFWMDVGAGNGELACLLSDKFPSARGYAVDFNDKPLSILNKTNIKWENADINTVNMNLVEKADIIFLITVLEHVSNPDILIEKLLRKLNHSGIVYVTVPDFGSLASRFLKEKWPYFLPGEHLYIPSKMGMQLLLERMCKKLFPAATFEIKVNAVVLPYSIGYYLNYFGLDKIPAWFSRAAVKLPTGILEASVKLSVEATTQY